MTQNNIQVIQRWYKDLWSEGDLAVADEIIDPDYAPEWVSIEAKGPAQVKHEVRYFRSVFPDLVYQIVAIVPQENQVWVRYRAKGTHLGSAWGFKPTNQQVTFEGAAIFTLNPTGKIADRWGAFCFYDILTDLGLVPPLWELSKHFQEPL